MKILNVGLILSICVIACFSGCSKEMELIDLYPNAGQSFVDIENDGYVVYLNAVPAPQGQIGTWRIFVGENGVIEDIHDPHSRFYGEPGEFYQLGWELSVDDQYKTDVITVSFKALNPVINTVVEDTVYNNVSLELEAEAARFGAQGFWRITSGTGGEILNSDNHIAQFIGDELNNYSVDWVLTYGSKEVSSALSFKTDVLKAYAGEDNLDIKTNKTALEKFYTMQAYLPPGGVASWQIIKGLEGDVISTDNPNSLFNGSADTLYSLVWNIQVRNYVSSDTVNLRFRGKYGVWKDPRDNQTYRFTEINGLEWMSENYNYAEAPGTDSFYYGYGYQGVIQDGNPVDTEEDRKKYGRLYTINGVLRAPEGWRLPTIAEYSDLITKYGGLAYSKPALTEGGKSGLDLTSPGIYEFSSGSDPALRNVFSGQDKTGMFWTSDMYDNNGGLAEVVINDFNAEQLGTSIVYYNYYALPVRYVREVQ